MDTQRAYLSHGIGQGQNARADEGLEDVDERLPLRRAVLGHEDVQCVAVDTQLGLLVTRITLVVIANVVEVDINVLHVHRGHVALGGEQRRRDRPMARGG